MTNRFLISVAALALFAGSGLANAQGTTGRDISSAGGQQMQHNAQPSGGAAERGGSMNKQKGTVGQAGGSSTMKSDEKSSGAMRDERSGAMNKNLSAEEKPGATRSQRTDERDQSQQQDKLKGREGAKGSMNAEGKSGTTSNTNNAESRQGTSTSMNAEGRTGTSNTTVGQAGAGAKLSTEQRTQITSVIREEHVAPVNNASFSVSVGTRIPRAGIELHALPSRVVTIYPEWRSYRYVLVRDEIVIIDPNTYEIIAVLNT